MDIGLVWDHANFRGDWFTAAGGLGTDAGVRTAVMVSLFTWRRAEPSYVPPAGRSQSRHGWWADTYAANPIGSRLWQLRYAVKTDETTLLRRAEDFCLEALQWMVTDGVVAGVAVACSWLSADAIGINVVVAMPGNQTLGFNFAWAWAGE